MYVSIFGCLISKLNIVFTTRESFLAYFDVPECNPIVFDKHHPITMPQIIFVFENLPCLMSSTIRKFKQVFAMHVVNPPILPSELKWYTLHPWKQIRKLI
ncbi:hypothetical protein L1887_10429 [Cichorium endivia]|nr:hypothetical protein L1887_10429 [Cichorium endivia]